MSSSNKEINLNLIPEELGMLLLYAVRGFFLLKTPPLRTLLPTPLRTTPFLVPLILRSWENINRTVKVLIKQEIMNQLIKKNSISDDWYKILGAYYKEIKR